MRPISPLRIGLLAPLIVPLFGLAVAAGAAAPTLPVHDGVGGDFSAKSSRGGEMRLSDLRGRVVLLFFGYTSCQDICPATLGHMKALQKHLGPAAEHVQVVLVTVDPENDTPEHLEEYLSRFDPGFIGLTGTPEEMDRILELYMAQSHKSHGMELTTRYNQQKSPVDQAYLYAHSQQIYLLDKRSRVRALFFVGSPLDQMRDAVLALLSEPDGTADHRTNGPAQQAPPQEKHDHHPEKEGPR